MAVHPGGFDFASKCCIYSEFWETRKIPKLVNWECRDKLNRMCKKNGMSDTQQQQNINQTEGKRKRTKDYLSNQNNVIFFISMQESSAKDIKKKSNKRNDDG